MQLQKEDLSFTTQTRAFCDKCDFLKSRCLCNYLKTIHNKVNIIVLQHPNETKHPLNTVRIMKKSFENLNIFVGEDFSSNQILNEVISNPKNNVVLLYPGPESKTLEKSALKSQSITHLIVIDGTWRKAKKIFLTSKNLHFIQTIKLENVTESQYKIRKVPNSEALSTLEATCEILNLIERDLDTSSAIEAFNQMIDMQIQKMGREVYSNNYLSKKKE